MEGGSRGDSGGGSGVEVIVRVIMGWRMVLGVIVG